MTTTVFTLPWPVSVNRAYRSIAGRSILSKDARAWKTAASISIMAQRQHIHPHTGKVRVLVELCAPDKRRRDCDNPLKLVLDAIVDAGIENTTRGRYEIYPFQSQASYRRNRLTP